MYFGHSVFRCLGILVFLYFWLLGISVLLVVGSFYISQPHILATEGSDRVRHNSVFMNFCHKAFRFYFAVLHFCVGLFWVPFT